MTSPKKTPGPLGNLSELLVLGVLAHEPRHGYEIVRRIRLLSEDSLHLGEGVLYPLLHALEADGALATRREHVNGRERVVYALTAAGRRRLDERREAYARIRSGIDRILGVDGHGRPEPS